MEMKEKLMVRKLNMIVKRFFDIFISLICLVAALPFLLIAIIGIKLFMPGPIFFKQSRVGIHKSIIKVYKLRTMKVDREAELSHDTSKDEERKTKWGNLLRRLKIDEIPQIVNVFIGNMSLVGPRPTIMEQADLYTEKELHRLDVRPGMTGLAQVNGNSKLIWEDRIEYDLEYVEKLSVWLDFKILVKTVLVVIFGEEKFYHPLGNETTNRFEEAYKNNEYSRYRSSCVNQNSN